MMRLGKKMPKAWEKWIKVINSFVFLENNLFFKVMKAINYKMKKKIVSFILSKEALETCNYSEYALLLLKRTSSIDKIEKMIYCATNPCEISMSKRTRL